jgi:spore photoproduct lyase
VQRILERNPGVQSQEFHGAGDLARWAELRGEERLRAERGVLVLRNQPQWTGQFDKIPHGAICRKFFKLNAYSGCNFWCEYCYLYKTHYMAPFSTHYVNYGIMERQLRRLDGEATSPILFNSGELADPLAVEAVTGWAESAVPFIGKLKNVRLLLLTKSDAVDGLLPLAHKRKTILSFSLNTDVVHRAFEHRTASPRDRIKAGAQAKKVGYPVRVRIDPLFFYPGWREDYAALVDMLYANFAPDVVTLGEYRPDKGLLGHIKPRFPNTDLAVLETMLVKDAGKLRFPDPLRVDMFKQVKDLIVARDSHAKIALCKESKAVWDQVGLKPAPLECNCAT